MYYLELLFGHKWSVVKLSQKQKWSAKSDYQVHINQYQTQQKLPESREDVILQLEEKGVEVSQSIRTARRHQSKESLHQLTK